MKELTLRDCWFSQIMKHNIRNIVRFVLITILAATAFTGCGTPGSGGRGERGLEAVLGGPKDLKRSWIDANTELPKEAVFTNLALAPADPFKGWQGAGTNFRFREDPSLVELHDGKVAIRVVVNEEFMRVNRQIYWAVYSETAWILTKQELKVWIPDTAKPGTGKWITHANVVYSLKPNGQGGFGYAVTSANGPQRYFRR